MSGTWCGECGRTECWDIPCLNPSPRALARRARGRLHDAAPDLLAALERLPQWLAERGCDLLLPTEDPRDSERPPFLDKALAAARGGDA
jgi:hypothetical protein